MSSFKTVNGMEACVTMANNNVNNAEVNKVFQNRKRYGGMRDRSE